MADATPQDPIAALKAQFGRLVVIEIDGETHALRPFDRAKLAQLQALLRKGKPEQELEVLTNHLEFVCVTDRAAFRAMADRYPLVVDQVYGVLLDAAKGNAVIEVR